MTITRYIKTPVQEPRILTEAPVTDGLAFSALFATGHGLVDSVSGTTLVPIGVSTLECDGSWSGDGSGYLKCPDLNTCLNDSQEFTLVAQLRRGYISGFQGFIGFGTESNRQAWIYSDGENCLFAVTTDDDRLRLIFPMFDIGENIIVFCNYDGAHMTVYVNDGATPYSQPLTGNVVSSTNTYWIGRLYGGYPPINGNIKNVMLYNRVITAAERTTIFNALVSDSSLLFLTNNGLNDYSRYNSTITRYGSGEYGNGLIKFNGSTDYFTIPSSSAPNNITLECIVTPDKTTGYQYLMKKNAVFTLALTYNTGKIRFDAFAGGYNVVMDTSNIVIGTRYYIVSTYDGTTAKLYVNNILVDSDSSFTGNLASNGFPLSVGADATPTHYTDGTIELAAMYGEAKNAAWVASRYNELMA